MSCSLIDIIRRRKDRSGGGLRQPGVESDPQVYRGRDTAKPQRDLAGSVSHPGFLHPPTDASESAANSLREFSLSELKSATKNFSVHNRLGEGGFGLVYKGCIKQKCKLTEVEERVDVAIKQLNTSGLQGHHEWVTEVYFLSMVDNPFLVTLIGYCAADDERGIQRLLVYEYMPNRGLDDHIFRTAAPALSWPTRVSVALGAARGLAYLHDVKGVIFRDFKTSNILLDEEFNPKLSDFGLARQGPDAGKSHVTTGVKGTYGYAAPEYVQTGHLTFKSDVYSFGVVLLEILTGRRAMDKNRPRLEQRLLEWVKPYINDSRKFHLAVDPMLATLYPTKAAMKFAAIAVQCLVKQPKARPRMSDIVEGLKKVLDLTHQWENASTLPTTTASSVVSGAPKTGLDKPSRQTKTDTARDTAARDTARDTVRDTARDTVRDTVRDAAERPPSNAKTLAPWERPNPPAFPLPSLELSMEPRSPAATTTNSDEGAKSVLHPQRARRARDPRLALESALQGINQGVNDVPVYYPSSLDVKQGINQVPLSCPRTEASLANTVAQAGSHHLRPGVHNRSPTPA